MQLHSPQLRLCSRFGVGLTLVGLLFFPRFTAYAQSSVNEGATAAEDQAQYVASQAGFENSGPLENATGGITEDELKQMLVGKPLFLRGGFLSDSLSFNEHGNLIGDSARGSYTLCGVQIEKVRMTSRKIQLEGARYGLHFLGAASYQDPMKAVDRVQITPKKKTLKITIDRERIVKPKKAKKKKHSSDDEAVATAAASSEVETQEERPFDPNAPTSTTSPAHSAMVLREALDRIFAPSIDERMIAAMPDFWKHYYQAAAARTDYKPSDHDVLYQDDVDQKARLLTKFEPPSNEYAQTYGVAGMSLYHVVIGADGKPREIVVARPIGFGLDENAVESIRKAKFEPAIKDGKPVPVLLDLVVQFRIYSKRTAVEGKAGADTKHEPVLPGPYTVQSQEEQK